MEEISLKPIITGDDLISIGMKPGAQFKAILDACIDAQDMGVLKWSNKKSFLERKGWESFFNH